jgi:AcrR family transcriptional regulator
LDKRIVKTRRMLRESLLALMREKPFEAIDIQDITDRADTARVTFYRHYGTKEELLVDVIENFYQELQGLLETMSVERLIDFEQTPPDQVIFDFLEQDRVLYKKLFTGSVSALIQQRLRHYIVQHVVLTFLASPRYADLPIGLIANHLASCMIGNIMWWLTEDVPYTSAYMARITHWMSLAGAMTLFGRADDLKLPTPDAWRMPE